MAKDFALQYFEGGGRCTRCKGEVHMDANGWDVSGECNCSPPRVFKMMIIEQRRATPSPYTEDDYVRED